MFGLYIFFLHCAEADEAEELIGINWSLNCEFGIKQIRLLLYDFGFLLEANDKRKAICGREFSVLYCI